jgi:heptosyltransferase-2
MAETKVPLPSTEADLPLPPAVSAAIREQFASCARPSIVLGIGASHPDKDWSDAAWIRFSCEPAYTGHGVSHRRSGECAAAFIAATGAERTINACGLRLIEAAALLRLADLFVGPSSGPLNLAAAGGTDAFGLRLVALYRPIRNLSTPSCRPAAPPLLA